MTKKTALIGYTGFVGSNLLSQHTFDDVYNSKNILDIKGKEYELVVCAGIKAQKWYANSHPEEDLNEIKILLEILSFVKIKRIVLISTIDVYSTFGESFEDSIIQQNDKNAYGNNRLFAEQWIINHFENYHILRLPALFGINLKKNFIYDLLHPVPSVLNEKLFNELKSIIKPEKFEIISNHFNYKNSQYVWDHSSEKEIFDLLDQYHKTSLMFTHPKDQFQFYPLSRLWKDIELIIKNNIKVVNLATEPVLADEIFRRCSSGQFMEPTRMPVHYDMKSNFSHLFNNPTPYLISKVQILNELISFMNESLKS